MFSDGIKNINFLDTLLFQKKIINIFSFFLYFILPIFILLGHPVYVFKNGSFCPFHGGRSNLRALDISFIFLELCMAHHLLFMHQTPPANHFAIIHCQRRNFFTLNKINKNQESLGFITITS